MPYRAVSTTSKRRQPLPWLKAGARIAHLCRRSNLAPDLFLQLGSGPGRHLLVVGESLAAHGWRESGRAFYRPDGRLLPSGRNLDLLLQQLGLSLDQVSFTDLVKCYIGDRRDLLAACAERCWPLFIRQLRSGQFRLLLLLGARTTRLIEQLGGCSLSVGTLRSMKIGGHQCSVLPIYHPSPVSPINHHRNERIVRLRRAAALNALTGGRRYCEARGLLRLQPASSIWQRKAGSGLLDRSR